MINIASLAGILIPAEFDFKSAGYVMAKWGAVALTRSFANSTPSVEQAEGIKAYAICPWYADTQLVRSMTDIETIEKKSKQKVWELLRA